MRYADVKVGEDYAYNPNGGRRAMDHPGYSGRVKILEPIELRGEEAKRQGFGAHFSWESVKGFRVKLLRKGYIGPQKRGTVFFTQARHLMRPWSEEAQRERDAEKADHYRDIEMFRELVAMTHLRARLAARGFGHWDWDDNRENDYEVRAQYEVAFRVEEMHDFLSKTVLTPYDADQELPVNSRLTVRRMKKHGEIRHRIFCNSIPVTDPMKQAKVREVYAVLTGKKPLPELPDLEEE